MCQAGFEEVYSWNFNADLYWLLWSFEGKVVYHSICIYNNLKQIKTQIKNSGIIQQQINNHYNGLEVRAGLELSWPCTTSWRIGLSDGISRPTTYSRVEMTNIDRPASTAIV